MSNQPPAFQDRRRNRNPDWATIQWHLQDGISLDVERYLQQPPDLTLLRDTIQAHCDENASEPDFNRAFRNYNDTFLEFWNGLTQIVNPVTNEVIQLHRALPKGPIIQIFHRGQRTTDVDHVPSHTSERMNAVWRVIRSRGLMSRASTCNGVKLIDQQSITGAGLSMDNRRKLFRLVADPPALQAVLADMANHGILSGDQDHDEISFSKDCVTVLRHVDLSRQPADVQNNFHDRHHWVPFDLFIKVLLEWKRYFIGEFSIVTILRMLFNNDKSRFSLAIVLNSNNIQTSIEDLGPQEIHVYIKAVQGASFDEGSVLHSGWRLLRDTRSFNAINARYYNIYGYDLWNSIGLHCTHEHSADSIIDDGYLIAGRGDTRHGGKPRVDNHFALKLPNEDTVEVSGAHINKPIWIFVNVPMAMQYAAYDGGERDGYIRWAVSYNQVLVTPDPVPVSIDGRGTPFLHIIDIRTGRYWRSNDEPPQALREIINTEHRRRQRQQEQRQQSGWSHHSRRSQSPEPNRSRGKGDPSSSVRSTSPKGKSKGKGPKGDRGQSPMLFRQQTRPTPAPASEPPQAPPPLPPPDTPPPETPPQETPPPEAPSSSISKRFRTPDTDPNQWPFLDNPNAAQLKIKRRSNSADAPNRALNVSKQANPEATKSQRKQTMDIIHDVLSSHAEPDEADAILNVVQTHTQELSASSSSVPVKREIPSHLLALQRKQLEEVEARAASAPPFKHDDTVSEVCMLCLCFCQRTAECIQERRPCVRRVYLDPEEQGAHYDFLDSNLHSALEHICATCLHNEYLRIKGCVSLDDMIQHGNQHEDVTGWSPKRCEDTTPIVETRGIFLIKFQNECLERYKTLNRVPWAEIVSYVFTQMTSFAGPDEYKSVAPAKSHMQTPFNHRDLSNYPTNTFSWDRPIREPWELRLFLGLWYKEDPYVKQILNRAHDANQYHQQFSAWLNDYIHTLYEVYYCHTGPSVKHKSVFNWFLKWMYCCVVPDVIGLHNRNKGIWEQDSWWKITPGNAGNFFELLCARAVETYRTPFCEGMCYLYMYHTYYEKSDEFFGPLSLDLDNEKMSNQGPDISSWPYKFHYKDSKTSLPASSSRDRIDLSYHQENYSKTWQYVKFIIDQAVNSQDASMRLLETYVNPGAGHILGDIRLELQTLDAFLDQHPEIADHCLKAIQLKSPEIQLHASQITAINNQIQAAVDVAVKKHAPQRVIPTTQAKMEKLTLRNPLKDTGTCQIVAFSCATIGNWATAQFLIPIILHSPAHFIILTNFQLHEALNEPDWRTWELLVSEGRLNSPFMQMHMQDLHSLGMTESNRVERRQRKIVIDNNTALLICIKDFAGLVQVVPQGNVFPAHETFTTNLFEVCLPYSWNDPRDSDAIMRANNCTTEEELLKEEAVLEKHEYDSLSEEQQELSHPVLAAGKQSWKFLTLTDNMNSRLTEEIQTKQNEALSVKSAKIEPCDDISNSGDSDDAMGVDDQPSLSRDELRETELEACQSCLWQQEEELIQIFQHVMDSKIDVLFIDTNIMGTSNICNQICFYGSDGNDVFEHTTSQKLEQTVFANVLVRFLKEHNMEKLFTDQVGVQVITQHLSEIHKAALQSNMRSGAPFNVRTFEDLYSEDNPTVLLLFSHNNNQFSDMSRHQLDCLLEAYNQHLSILQGTPEQEFDASIMRWLKDKDHSELCVICPSAGLYSWPTEEDEYSSKYQFRCALDSMLEYKIKLTAPGTIPEGQEHAPLGCSYVPVDYTARSMLAVLKLNSIAIWDNDSNPRRLPPEDWNHIIFRRPLGLSVKPKTLRTQNVLKHSTMSSAASSSSSSQQLPAEWGGGSQTRTGTKRPGSSIEGKSSGKRARTSSPSSRSRSDPSRVPVMVPPPPGGVLGNIPTQQTVPQQTAGAEWGSRPEHIQAQLDAINQARNLNITAAATVPVDTAAAYTQSWASQPSPFTDTPSVPSQAPVSGNNNTQSARDWLDQWSTYNSTSSSSNQQAWWQQRAAESWSPQTSYNTTWQNDPSSWNNSSSWNSNQWTSQDWETYNANRWGSWRDYQRRDDDREQSQMTYYHQRYTWDNWQPPDAPSAANSDTDQRSDASSGSLHIDWTNYAPTLDSRPPNPAPKAVGMATQPSVSAQAERSRSQSVSAAARTPNQSVNRWAHRDVFYNTRPNEPFPRANTPFSATNAPGIPVGTVRPRPSLPPSMASVPPRPAFLQRPPLPKAPVFPRPGPRPSQADFWGHEPGSRPAG